MALKLRKVSPLRAGILSTLMVAFALAIQPVYSLVTSQEVGAVATVHETVYDASVVQTPETNFLSSGIQAHSSASFNYQAFGDRVVLGGSARTLETVSFGVSSWPLQTDASSVSWCAANPGTCSDAGFLYPATLTIYTGPDITFLHSVTQNVFIPWRPAGDESCPAGLGTSNKGWMQNGQCYNWGGIVAYPTFNLAGSGITVPDDVIFSIGWNTRNYGLEPTGVAGPIDSVNSIWRNSSTHGTSVGTDQDVNQAFVRFNSNPSLSVANWGAAYNLSIRVTATMPAAPTVPTITSVVYTEGHTGGDVVANGGITNSEHFTFNLQASEDVTRYQLRYWNDIEGSAFRGQDNAWPLDDIAASGYMTTPGVYQDRLSQADGVHYFSFSVCNATGCSEFSEPFVVTYDAVAPIASISLGWTTAGGSEIVSGGYTNEIGGVAHWTASDSSDVASYIYRYWNDIEGNQYKESTPYEAPVASMSLPGTFTEGTGTHYFCVAAIDHAGNVSDCSSPFVVVYDAVAPAAPVVTSPVASTEFPVSQRTIRATWDAASDENGIARYEIEYTYTRNGTVVTDYREVAGNRLYRDQSLSGTVLSDFTIRVRAQDRAGNWSEWSLPVTYYYGVSAPAEEVDDEDVMVDDGDEPISDNGSTPPPSIITETVSPQQQPEQSILQVGGGIPVATVLGDTATAIFPQNQFFAQIIGGTADSEVLGEQDEATPADSEDGDVLGRQDQSSAGTPLTNTASFSSNANKLFGLVWYWWFIIPVALIAGWLLLAALIRRHRENEEA